MSPKDEIVKKNIGLTFDFIRAAVADPHLLDKIPDGAEIDFAEIAVYFRPHAKR